MTKIISNGNIVFPYIKISKEAKNEGGNLIKTCKALIKGQDLVHIISNFSNISSEYCFNEQKYIHEKKEDGFLSFNGRMIFLTEQLNFECKNIFIDNADKFLILNNGSYQGSLSHIFRLIDILKNNKSLGIYCDLNIIVNNKILSKSLKF